MSTASLKGSAQPLSTAYDTALLDLDGVVYIGAAPVPRAAPAIADARASGMSMAFVTNNASRTPVAVATHLTDLGVTASPDEVVTSSMAAAWLLTTLIPAGATVLVIGGIGLHDAIGSRGFAVTEVDRPDVAAVVQGYGPNVSWELLAEASLAVRRDVPWVATNLDSTLPSPRGLLPGNGALVAAVTAATGRVPISAGKPELPLHEEAVRRTKAKNPLVVGDRLDTDIESAVRARCDSLLVLTGVSDVQQLLTAPPERRPSYVAADLDGLNEPHPEVALAANVATCGAWRATRDGDAITLSGSDAARPADALRAATVVAWLDPAPAITVHGDIDLAAAFANRD